MGSRYTAIANCVRPGCADARDKRIEDVRSGIRRGNPEAALCALDQSGLKTSKGNRRGRPIS
jgi:hypothetical protein